MENNIFYSSVAYKERQAEITRKNWQKGIYDFLRKREKRQCTNPQCGKWFETEPADPKKFCSRKCAAQVNNPKRSNVPINAKEKLLKLYQKGLSMQEISDKADWRYGKIVYLMKKFNIPRRSRSEAIYFKWNPNGNPFKIKNRLNKNETLLKGLGLGLYWGEGDKNSISAVRIGNTDPQLIKIFREFLTKICGVKQEKLKYTLEVFNDSNDKEAIKFWTRQLGIRKNQLGKVTIIPPQGKGTYRKKNQTGVLAVAVYNKKLKEEIMKMLNLRPE